MKTAVVTATRAEYGILQPLIRKLHQDSGVELQLLVTGTHLSEKYGNTQREIEQDGFPVFARFPILMQGNAPADISRIMARALEQFAGYFERETPDCVVVLGDRTEMLGVCAAAMNAGVPIAHLHGGELTEGAVDDCVRHSITKMAYLHFPSTEVYRKRIIQMGEAPERVFNVGALSVENILHVPLLDRDEIEREAGIPAGTPYAVVTFHPVTRENGREREQVKQLIAAMERSSGYFYLITKANADAGGDTVNALLEDFTSRSANAGLVASLGMRRYLSAVRHASFVLGNSSSGIVEAPCLGTPTVNIGDRQKGRLMADSIVNCLPETDDILQAMALAAGMEHRPSFLYGDGETSGKIVDILKKTFGDGRPDLKKAFYDISFEGESV